MNRTQRVRRRTAGLIGQAEGAGNRDRHDCGVGDRREIDVPDAVAEIGRNAGGDFSGKTRLARATGTGQRHQPVVGQQRTHLVNLRAAADETGELDRKIMGINAFGGRNGGNSLRRSGWHSCVTRSGRGKSRS